jgi:hypothetical protein
MAALIDAAGLWFLIAASLEALATFVEVAGAPRSPEEDAPRQGFVALAVLAVTTLTPGLLFLHGFMATNGAEPMLRVWALGAPAAALLGGALLGGMFGVLAGGAAGLMRRLALPFGVAALAAAIYAALPSVLALAEALRAGGLAPP